MIDAPTVSWEPCPSNPEGIAPSPCSSPGDMVEELEIRAEQVAAHPTDPSKVIVTIKTKSVSMHHIIDRAQLELALRGASSGTVLCSVSEQGPSLTTL